jgi:hypothetical protein
MVGQHDKIKACLVSHKNEQDAALLLGYLKGAATQTLLVKPANSLQLH